MLIDSRHEGLYYFGATDRYLQVAPGEASRDILAMAREGVRARLRAAILRSAEENARVIVTGGHVKRAGGPAGVSVAVMPVPDASEALFLISFIDEPGCGAPPGVAAEAAACDPRIARLEQELDATRAQLCDARRNLDIANEEHRAVYEEAMTVNEEFQSTNEELENSKGELQSLNAALTALNGQLQETVKQLRATSSDLQNILNSSDVAPLFLDNAFNIRFFTPGAKSLFNIVAADIGRPLAGLTRRLNDDAILSDARTVLATLAPQRREVEADAGKWYIRRILPYRDGNRIDGVVITFADISEMKAVERELQAARAYSDSIITQRQSDSENDARDDRLTACSRSARSASAGFRASGRLWPTVLKWAHS